MNPLAAKLMPWRMALVRRQFVFVATLPLVWSEVFWRTWAEVYRGPR